MAQGAAVKHKKKTKSVLKNIRQSAHRAAVNRMNRTRVRTSIRRMRGGSATGDTADGAKLWLRPRFPIWTRPFARGRSLKTRRTVTSRASRWR